MLLVRFRFQQGDSKLFDVDGSGRAAVTTTLPTEGRKLLQACTHGMHVRHSSQLYVFVQAQVFRIYSNTSLLYCHH